MPSLLKLIKPDLFKLRTAGQRKVSHHKRGFILVIITVIIIIIIIIEVKWAFPINISPTIDNRAILTN